MLRSVFATTIFACALLAPGTADAAGAVLPLSSKPEPAFVDMRMAAAVTPTGSTRWSEITVPSATPAMWLVPVRPGAAVDWAPRRWLDAIDEATAPRVLPPSFASTCPSRSTPEVPEAWTHQHSMQPAPALTVLTTADGARAHVAERGYRLDPAIAGRISALHASGWNLVALEMAPSSFELSSGTLRVSDDGGPVLPLALSGGSSTRVTVFAFGAGVASVPGTRDVDREELRWGPAGSTYETWRSDLVKSGSGGIWLRESASHDAIFDWTLFAGGNGIASVVAGYFQGTACTSVTASNVSASDGIVGTSCAPGAAARVPGGAACTPSSGSVDPSALSCTANVDLALALSGLSPASAVVTRLVGWIPASELGTDLPIAFAPAAKRTSPVIRASAYVECPPTPGTTSPPKAPPSPRPPLSSTSSSSSSGDVYVPVSDGCSGGTVATGTTYEEEEPPPEDDSSSTEGCGGDGSSSGWDTEDDSDGWDDSDSGDSCSTDDSSSSSSDSCSGGSSSSSSGGSDDGWDTEDSDDGWDTEDGMSPQGKKLGPASKKPKPHARTTKKKSSPVSRYALLAAALLLPLRRRRRGSEGG